MTHWWDGSQIYGSDQADAGPSAQRRRRQAAHRRRRQRCRRIARASRRPGSCATGGSAWRCCTTSSRCEHNAICDELKRAHPDWDDARLFNIARLVNAAVMAKIHSIEWTPAILPNEALNLGLNSNWYGMLTYRFRKAKDRKTVAEYNVSNPELGRPRRQPHQPARPTVRSDRGVRRGLSPALAAARDAACCGDHGDDQPIDEVPFVASRQAGSAKLSERVPMVDLFYSFGNQHPGACSSTTSPRSCRR